MGDTRMNIYNSSTGKQASQLASCWEELLGTAAGNCLLCARAQHSKLRQSWGTGGWDGMGQLLLLFLQLEQLQNEKGMTSVCAYVCVYVCNGSLPNHCNYYCDVNKERKRERQIRIPAVDLVGGEKEQQPSVCVYSFVSVFVCWTLTYWLAPAAAGRQASKQSMKEGRKEGSFACLLACL